MNARTVVVSIQRMQHAVDFPLPEYQTQGSAAVDMRAANDAPITLEPGQITVIPTGFKVAVPPGHEAQLRPRSGLAARHGITLPNSPATIDSDYRGEIMVPLINLGREAIELTRGLRICQLVVLPVPRIEWFETESLEPTERGEGGFGHTGL